MNLCPHCGAPISPRDPTCSYCGTPNPHYQPPADEVNHLLQQGMTAFQQKDYASAIDFYQQAITHDPEVFNAYFYLAASFNALGREREAIGAMQSAHRLRPGSAAVEYNLGILYKHMGQTQAAREHLQHARQKALTDPALDDPQRLIQTIDRESQTL